MRKYQFTSYSNAKDRSILQSFSLRPSHTHNQQLQQQQQKQQLPQQRDYYSQATTTTTTDDGGSPLPALARERERELKRSHRWGATAPRSLMKSAVTHPEKQNNRHHQLQRNRRSFSLQQPPPPPPPLVPIAAAGEVPPFSEFSLSDLKSATNGFSSDTIISESGFIILSSEPPFELKRSTS